MLNEMDAQTMREFIDCLEGVAILDQERRYVYVNSSWERITGMSASNALGKYVLQVYPDSHAQEVFETGKPAVGKVIHSQEGPCVATYFPRLNAQGQVVGVFINVIIRDVISMQGVYRRISELTEVVEFYKQELSQVRGARYSLDNIVGISPSIVALRESIVLAARSTSTVLIEGETGSGKELIAHAIHTLSSRSAGNFVRVNCSAIPEELMESEFFGYAPGAFTGALKKGKIGRFELAHQGSLFLDEVNLLSTTMQPKFLRVLQEMEIDPVGGDKSVPVDVRVIAASNTPLEHLVEESKFRSDLYYRLNVIRIQAPALRERIDDIPLLVDHLIHSLNRQMGMVVEGIGISAMELLQQYHWPGNVRELRNSIESAMNLADSSILRRKDFAQLERRISDKNQKSRSQSTGFNLKKARQNCERELIQDALTATGGNRVQAAMLLGISRTVLYNKMDLFSIK